MTEVIFDPVFVEEEHSSPGDARECAHFNCAQAPWLAAVCVGGGSCSCRTNHPLVASGSEEPSHKIELVFSAGPENSRRSIRSRDSVAQSDAGETWQPARRVILIFSLRSRFYAATL
jgi:hypothetical protein